jgi:hypothetical protein
MANLILNGSTSGSVTLSSPAVSGTTTLTLPTTSGTVLTNGTNTNFPAGSVLQVVNATNSTYATTTSTTYADTGLTASITPSSSSSKILVIVSLNGVGKNGFNTTPKYQLVRNSTAILGIDNSSGFTGTTGYGICSTTANYLDSPSTTSATTYKVQYAIEASGGTAYFNFYLNIITNSTITLMEIKG